MFASSCDIIVQIILMIYHFVHWVD